MPAAFPRPIDPAAPIRPRPPRAARGLRRGPGLVLVTALVTALLAAGTVRAERADRFQPIVIEADKPGTLDLQRQIVTFAGNVQIVQGTMTIRAERIEVRELPGGHRVAVATGEAGRQASYRQKREGLDEHVEAAADRIDYDSGAGTLVFTGNAAVRRLRAGEVADEITGGLIRWDGRAELFSVEGGVPGTGTGGRVRAILTPPPPPAEPGGR